MTVKPHYWFPAKEYGWGWGPPTCWQGWAAIAVFVALVCLTTVMCQVLHRITLGQNLVLMALLTIALTFVCWLKGEPPKWRWGKR